MKKYLKKGFTLIELIVVVSVIAILMSMVVPATQKVMLNSRKSKAQSYMKQIATAYCSYYNENGYIPSASSSMELAEKFAQEGYMNNANLLVYPGDSSAPEVLQENIYPIESGSHAWASGKQLSVVLVGGITKSVNTSTTPIAYTRGYSDPKWSTSAPFGTEGGFVAFLDGTVRWYSDTTDKLSVGKDTTGSLKTAIEGAGGASLDTGTGN